jgi:6-phosphogluconolactonase
MKIEVLEDEAAVARAGAAALAEAIRAAVAARGACTLALSGGRTPWLMLNELAVDKSVPWQRLRVVQVDERVAPADSADRNLKHLRACLGEVLPPANLHPMPVEAPGLAAAAAAYARTLEGLAGTPPVLDVVHLGLGPDGHTASLVPGDPVLAVTDAWVGITGAYQQHRRMTLTYPVLNRARRVLFVVTGAEKADALLRLSRHDPTIPAGRIANADVTVLADRAAAARLDRAAQD